MLRYVRQVKDKFSNNCNSSLFDINKGQCNKKLLISEATKFFKSSGRNSYYFVVQSENLKGTVCRSVTTAERKTGNDDFKKKYGYRLNTKCHQFLNALQWSSALICGWYASQLLCLNHRNRHLSFDSSKCYYSKYLLSTTRAIHTNVRYFLKPQQSEDGAPPLPELTQAPTCFESSEIRGKRITPKKAKGWDFYNELHEFYHGNFTANPYQPFAGSDHFGKPYETIVYNVNNGEQEESSGDTANVVIEENHTGKIVEQKVTPVQNTPEQVVQDTKINDAYENLLNVIGEIEFQLGVHSLMAQNYANAVSHFKQGSNHHHSGAIFNLGLCYEQGLGVKKDLNMAMKLYEMAATKGHPKAAYNLGVFYARGLGGLDKNVRMARKYFHQAASMGQQDAINALGLNAIKEEPKRIESSLKVPNDRAIMKQEIAVT